MTYNKIVIYRDFDRSYYANIIKYGEQVSDSLPQHVDYKTLRKAIADQMGVAIPSASSLGWESCERKRYAVFYIN